MKKKEQLFYLIKSMDEAEKKRFRKYSNEFGSDPAYLRLFNYIDTLSEYDETKIKKHFAAEKFINQFHVIKNYLRARILDSLREQKKEQYIKSEIMSLLGNADILYKKELYEMALENIRKAKKLACEHEEFPLLFETLDWERKLYIRFSEPIGSAEKIKKNISALNEKLQLYSAGLLYWEYLSGLLSRFEERNIPGEEWLKEKKLDLPGKIPSYQAGILFHHIRFIVFMTSGLNEKALNEIDKLISYMETFPAKINDDPSSYLTALNNKTGFLLGEKKFNEVTELLNKIRNFTADKKQQNFRNLATRAALRTFNIELEIYRDTGKYSAAEKIISDFESYSEDNKENLPSDYLILIYYQSSYIFFMDGKYNKSLDYINRVFHGSFSGLRSDIQTYARFLNLMIHYELKNFLALKYSVATCRRYLSKRGNTRNYEKKLLKFFSAVSSRHPDKHKSFFLKLAGDLFTGVDEKTKKDILDYCDFEDWIKKNLD